MKFRSAMERNARLDELEREYQQYEPTYQPRSEKSLRIKELEAQEGRLEKMLAAKRPRALASPTARAALSIALDPAPSGRPNWTADELMGLTRHVFYQAGASIVGAATDLPGRFTAFEHLCSVNGIKLPWQPAATAAAWNQGSPVPKVPAALVPKYTYDIERLFKNK